ncbi:MAG TPA: hypothetical protein PLX47_04250 [Coprothermobacter proteolyticus]|nr:hypothetical protein [Coprothermobacter proteolyticus]
MNLEMPKDRICLGRFGKVFGLKGEIYFNLYGSEDILRTTDEFYLENGTLLKVERLGVGPDGRFVVKLLGYDTPESVETFVNQKVYVKGRSGKGDTYTTSELLEMDVIVNGQVVGRVLDLQGTDEAPFLLLEINGELRRAPFTREALSIDRVKKTITVSSEGFLV